MIQSEMRAEKKNEREEKKEKIVLHSYVLHAEITSHGRT